MTTPIAPGWTTPPDTQPPGPHGLLVAQTLEHPTPAVRPIDDAAGLVDLVELLGLIDPAVVHAGVPQAQGDVLVLPWPAHTAPTDRDRAVRAARPVPCSGRVVLHGRQGHTHTVLPDGPHVHLAPDDLGTGLGVLVVAAGSVAVLAHEQHPDLHIGEGVYLLRRQRRHTPEEPQSPAAYITD